MISNHRLGAIPGADGVSYCVWAPEISAVQVVIESRGSKRALKMGQDRAGYYQVCDHKGAPGDHYQYALNGKALCPDPASRAQASGVHGPSVVVDPTKYCWNDQGWRRPPVRDLVIYELHIGTFTAEGTFRSAAEKFPLLRELGVTAVETMPLADFPGRWNWGYDGVLPYAPARCYGSPEDLRFFVDNAHAHGLAVILDVVYNHFGPDGDYLRCFSPHYFHPSHQTPWGSAFNSDGPESGPVRKHFSDNPIYWMEEHHIDGFRFDAAHEIRDDSRRHILAEMAEAIRARGGYAIGEDARNESKTITSGSAGGWGWDAVWADDFHHSVRVSQTKERTAYFRNFDGSLHEIVDTLLHGWHHRGQQSGSNPASRGTPCRHLPPQRFVHCISNHDQTGNRAFGERVHHLIPGAGYRALSALLCLSPYTPLLFMGQEWAASTPFLFFTDHNPELGARVTEGRRQEFSEFPEFADPSRRATIPDPQAPETFERSKLVWSERESGGHARMLDLYRECLRLRFRMKEFRPLTREGWTVRELPWGAGMFQAFSPDRSLAVVFDLAGGHAGEFPDAGQWTALLSTDSGRYGGGESVIWDAAARSLSFGCPGVIVLQRDG